LAKLVDLFRVLHERTASTWPSMTKKRIQLLTDGEDEIIDLPVTACALLLPPAKPEECLQKPPTKGV
jgi:hypothetical protein